MPHDYKLKTSKEDETMNDRTQNTSSIRTLHQVGPCTLSEWRLSDTVTEYRMTGGKFGGHALSIEDTSGERLEAHWIGYLAANGLKFEPNA